MPRFRHRRLIPTTVVTGLVLLLSPEARTDEPSPADEPVKLAAHESEESLADRVQIVERSTSSRSARENAIRSLPVKKLSAADRLRVDEVVRNVSLYRQLPVVTFQAEADVCRFFVENPDVAVSVWRAMEISEFQLKRVAEGRYEGADREGSTGTIDVLYQTAEETLALCDGVYRGPLIPNGIHAQALFHLTNKSAPGPDGRNTVTSRLQMLVAFPSTTVETVAKLVSPVSNLIVDRNFREIGCFVHLMSTGMERQPGWVEHISRKLDGLTDARRDELLKLTARIYVEARQRELAEREAIRRRG
jgi:hypothetical protein